MTFIHSADRSAWQELRSGARKQTAVIMAIVFKDFRARMGQSRLGLMWVLVEPMTAMAVLSTLWYLIGRTHIDGVHVTLFIATGIIPLLIVRTSISRIHASVKRNMSLFDYQQVKPVDAIFASFLLNMLLILMAGVVLFFVLAWVFGVTAEFPRIPEMIGMVLMLLAMGLGFAMVISVYGNFYESLPRACSVATRPLLFISAVMYSPNDLPNAAREILSWNPLLQFIVYIRHYGLGLNLIPESDFRYIAGITMASLGLGFLAYYVNRFKLIQR